MYPADTNEMCTKVSFACSPHLLINGLFFVPALFLLSLSASTIFSFIRNFAYLFFFAVVVSLVMFAVFHTCPNNYFDMR